MFEKHCGKACEKMVSENKYVLIKIEKGKRKGKVFVVNGNPCNEIRSCGLHYMDYHNFYLGSNT